MGVDWQALSAMTPAQVIDWAEQSWAYRLTMEATTQEASYHAEGDVWTHTKMVLRELTNLDGWADLSVQDRAILTCTALFHDAGKAVTTKLDPETGRVVSPKHSAASEKIARSALRNLGCPLELREEICRTVRCHGRPAFLMDKPFPDREVVTHSWWLNNRLLHLFTLADHRGRVSETPRPEDDLHYWRIMAEENGCFDGRFPFSNSAMRVNYFRRPDADLYYVPYENYKSSVTMMSGLPGSGKDTWLQKNRAGHPVVSLDDVRADLDVDPADDQGEVARVARERCKELLRGGQDFAFNATNVTRLARRRWLDLFLDYGAYVHVVYLEPPLETILSQNKMRKPGVPEDVIHRLNHRLEPPTWAEAHEVSYVG